jgi:hypothetical protein
MSLVKVFSLAQEVTKVTKFFVPVFPSICMNRIPQHFKLRRITFSSLLGLTKNKAVLQQAPPLEEGVEERKLAPSVNGTELSASRPGFFNPHNGSMTLTVKVAGCVRETE